MAATLLVVALSIAIALRLRVHPNTGAALEHEIPPVPVFSSSNPESIYAADPGDAWNRIFHLLFSSTIKARIGEDLSTAGPFTTLDDGMSGVRATTRTFDHFEIGDRAIDPLYPSFLNDAGVRRILSEPQFSQLQQALTAALDEKSSRTPLARALMQSDVWAAYDILFETKRFTGAEASTFARRREELLSLLGRFVKKLAFTSDEVGLLPDNYSLASSENKLPDLLAPNSPWLEIQSTPHRVHDQAAYYRRFARVFLKPVDPSITRNELLERLRQENFFSQIDSVALVMQNLLVDNGYSAVPTHLTTEVQIRTFVRDQSARIVRTDIQQYEINRRSILSGSVRDGLIEVDDKTPVYLPEAGNDYQFASPMFTKEGNDFAVQVSLRKRCEACHGLNASGIFTISGHHAPTMARLSVLAGPENAHGWYVAGRKWERADFQALRIQR